MKVGPEHSSLGLTEGIHWHINQDVKIEYIATSRDREYLPWVRYINTSSGDTVVYNDMYASLDKESVDTMEIRVMDCIDCHNRPSHHYLPPQEFTDMLIASGEISSDLPEIKRLAMDVLSTPFNDRDSARLSIKTNFYDFYSSNYPNIMVDRRDDIDMALEALLQSYSKNIFPEMGASWDVYPNHIGHVEFNGCFRCHNGNHKADNGSLISRDCNLCHTILGQGTKDNYETVAINSTLEFKHPVDIDESWKEYACTDCHRYLY